MMPSERRLHPLSILFAITSQRFAAPPTIGYYITAYHCFQAFLVYSPPQLNRHTACCGK